MYVGAQVLKFFAPITKTASDGTTEPAQRERARTADAAATSGENKEKPISQRESMTKSKTEKLVLFGFIDDTSRIKIGKKKSPPRPEKFICARRDDAIP